MGIPEVMGSEIEFALSIRNYRGGDPYANCVLLVNAYREAHETRTLWDYEQESPLSDARGFTAEGEAVPPNLHENLARNKTLANGARYYVDHAHPEYSCPEVTTPRALVVHECAGLRVLEESRRAAQALLPPGAQIYIHKNNSDGKGNSYGCHENYLMQRRTPFKRIAEQLLPFFVSRQVYAGAGKVGSENGAPACDFQLSQRADFFETEISLDTMVKRPIINTRDEAHADREKYRRLHVICGDSNMCEYAIWLRQGATALVLGMIEDGALTRDLQLRDPVRAIRETSHDTTLRRAFSLMNGRKLTALELQREYLEAAHAYAARTELPGWAAEIIQHWGEVLDALSRDPYELADRLDWVAKKALMEAFMQRRGLNWNAPELALMDLQYHDVRPEKGLYYLLQRQGRVRRIAADAEIARAVFTPPEDTRAYFRGQCLQRYGAEVFGVNWDAISFRLQCEAGGVKIKRVRMDEPLKGTKAHVQKLLENAKSAAELVAALHA